MSFNLQSAVSYFGVLMRIYSLKFEGAKLTVKFSHLIKLFFLLAKLCVVTLILVFCHKMLERFVLLKSGKQFLAGF